MKSFIKNKLRENLLGSKLCNTMTVNTYEEGIEILIKHIGKPEENPADWGKIEKPLRMWKEITDQIRSELKTGATGDSEVDESDTWWSAIISVFCK